MTACMNVMFHPMGWGGHHITVRKMEENFLSKCFMSSGTESGIFCVAEGTETSGLTMGKTLGKGILPVAGAITIQANSTWLVSGATVILNFLKKSMPRMGPATAACKNLAVNSMPETRQFWKRNPKRGLVGYLLP
jgi:hypothetical protein